LIVNADEGTWWRYYRVHSHSCRVSALPLINDLWEYLPIYALSNTEYWA
jgi:hypothetical protein